MKEKQNGVRALICVCVNCKSHININVSDHFWKIDFSFLLEGPISNLSNGLTGPFDTHSLNRVSPQMFTQFGLVSVFFFF